MAYRAGHVPGSVNIRDDCLEDMLRHGTPFPAGRTIVLICPAGDYSQRLAAFLTRAGHDAASLAGGIVAWRDASLPLESSLLRGGRAAVAAGSRPGVRPVGSYPASSTAALSAARSGIGSAVTRTVPVPEPGPGLPNALSRPCPRHARGPRRGRAHDYQHAGTGRVSSIRGGEESGTADISVPDIPCSGSGSRSRLRFCCPHKPHDREAAACTETRTDPVSPRYPTSKPEWLLPY